MQFCTGVLSQCIQKSGEWNLIVSFNSYTDRLYENDCSLDTKILLKELVKYSRLEITNITLYVESFFNIFMILKIKYKAEIKNSNEI